MIPCSHRPPCAGCVRYGEPGIAPAARDRLDALAREHGLAGATAESGETTGFRLRARLAIRGRLGAPKIGLYELGTHRVVHVPHCQVHHPLINHVASVVRRALVDARITCYSDAAQLGLARYLQVTVERSSQTAQVVLVGNCATPEPLAECLELIRFRLGHQLHSLWFNSQTERSNNVLGPVFHHIHGPPSVIERFGGAAVHYPPGAFGQSNLEIAERIIAHVRDEIPQGARVAEFYAGVGAIGLSVVERVSALSMNEIGARSLQGLALGVATLDPDMQAKLAIVPGAAGASAKIAQDADVVIVDPPRKGLDPVLSEHLQLSPPRRLVYVSCGLESLLSDTRRLISRGTLRLTGLRAFNLMPYTDHVETVARFEAVANARQPGCITKMCDDWAISRE